jgi:hypothetical protein
LKERKGIIILPLLLALLLTTLQSVSAANAIPTVAIGKTVTVDFPSANDTWSISHNPYMWTEGDYIQGTRDLGRFANLTGMRSHVVLSQNSLWGIGEVHIDVYVNGVKEGSFVVKPGDSAVDASFSFKMLCKGGVVTIKYLETNTVPNTPNSSYGSITISSTSSTVTFTGIII